MWTQWYGPTILAEWNHNNGDPFNYDEYSQGWHGGLDIGAAAGSPVYTGINQAGVVVRVRNTAHGVAVYIQFGDWVVIYQHVNSSLKKYDPVTANMFLGTVVYQTNEYGNDNSHLHLEIRYVADAIVDGEIVWGSDEQMIHNPLEFMSQTMVDGLIEKFLDVPYSCGNSYCGEFSPTQTQFGQHPKAYYGVLRVTGCVIWDGNCGPGDR